MSRFLLLTRRTGLLCTLLGDASMPERRQVGRRRPVVKLQWETGEGGLIGGLEPRVALSTASAPAQTIVVGFQGVTPSTTVRQAITQMGGSITRTFASGAAEVRLPQGTDVTAALERLGGVQGVRYAVPNVVGTWKTTVPTFFEFPPLPLPTGPLFRFLYGLNSSSLPPPDSGLTRPIDIDAPQAWASLSPARDRVLVAVLDSGIDPFHPDLERNIQRNLGEIEGNGSDDDLNGYIDDLIGFNTADHTNDVRDNVGHGTFVSAIIAAPYNSGSGVVGVDFGARILPVKIGDEFPTLTGFLAGVEYAVANGARVINASLGLPRTAAQAVTDAIQLAAGAGVVVVTAAGNEGENTDIQPVYPAAAGLQIGPDGQIIGGARLRNVINVASIDSAGNLSAFSNRGVNTVDIAAPGEAIVSLVPTGSYRGWRFDPADLFRPNVSYAFGDGSSFAAPYVTGVASLLISQFPTLSAEEVVQRILATARPLPSLEGQVASGGMVNAHAALLGIPYESIPQNVFIPNQPTQPVTPLLVQPRNQMRRPLMRTPHDGQRQPQDRQNALRNQPSRRTTAARRASARPRQVQEAPPRSIFLAQASVEPHVAGLTGKGRLRPR